MSFGGVSLYISVLRSNFKFLFLTVFKVLGAAMFYAKVGDAAMVYTGDYNMTPDRHLGAAQIDRLHLDLLITEYDIIPRSFFMLINHSLIP